MEGSLDTEQPSAAQGSGSESLRQTAPRQSRVRVGWLFFGAVLAEAGDDGCVGFPCGLDEAQKRRRLRNFSGRL